MSKADELINEISTKTPKRTACGQLQMMNIFKHIFVSKFHISLKNATSKYYSLTEKTDVQTFHKNLTRQEKKNSEKVSYMLSNENEISAFLSSGHSYNQKIGTDWQRFLKHPKLQVKNYQN